VKRWWQAAGRAPFGRWRIVAASVVLAAGLAFPPPRPAADQLVTRTAFLMGTRVRIEVRAIDRRAGLRASETALRALESAARRLSTWRDDSELSRLNATPVGRPMSLSPSLFATLSQAEACSRATGGAFDPAIGPLVDAWGLRTGGRLPSMEERRVAVRRSGSNAFDLSANGSATRRWTGARIEEGGFGKGAALDEALAAVRDMPGIEAILLDLGGQVGVATVGDAGSTRNWSIELAHPELRDEAVARLSLESGSIATSGNSEHGIEVDGVRYGHLIDPRSGDPAEDFGTLVVLAADGLEADCLSTGLYVLGPDAALQWALRHPGVEVAVLQSQGEQVRVRATPGLARRIQPIGAEAFVEQTDGIEITPYALQRASTNSVAGEIPGHAH